ncbi:MAG: thiamine diphosphokinase [Clostridia bacterium]|nr:thiamine diphosphokinase [Clostridia bacterium]
MRAVVIGAGDIHDYDYIKTFIREGDFIIAADGGLEHAKKMGAVPNLTVGDFDSWKGEVSGEVLKFNPEKDYTDADLAVKEALGRGCDEIVLLGCTGTRLDHTLANIGLLEYIAHRGAKGTLVNENNIVTVITHDTEICGDGEGYLSFIPIGKVEGVTLKNLKYTLNERDLRFEETLTVSNEFIGEKAEVKIKSGSLIMIKSHD